jgi:hypothetical protein
MVQVVIIELSNGPELERDATSWGHAASQATEVTFRITPNGDLVLLVFDEVVEAFAAGVWITVRRDWVVGE